jgi:hypothetical protein
MNENFFGSIWDAFSGYKGLPNPRNYDGPT